MIFKIITINNNRYKQLIMVLIIFFITKIKKILRNIYYSLYMSITVVDLNEEVKEEAPALEQIEEAPEEKPVETDKIMMILIFCYTIQDN